MRAKEPGAAGNQDPFFEGHLISPVVLPDIRTARAATPYSESGSPSALSSDSKHFDYVNPNDAPVDWTRAGVKGYRGR
jgi:hypothetical protein